MHSAWTAYDVAYHQQATSTGHSHDHSLFNDTDGDIASSDVDLSSDGRVDT